MTLKDLRDTAREMGLRVQLRMEEVTPGQWVVWWKPTDMESAYCMLSTSSYQEGGLSNAEEALRLIAFLVNQS